MGAGHGSVGIRPVPLRPSRSQRRIGTLRMPCPQLRHFLVSSSLLPSCLLMKPNARSQKIEGGATGSTFCLRTSRFDLPPSCLRAFFLRQCFPPAYHHRPRRLAGGPRDAAWGSRRAAAAQSFLSHCRSSFHRLLRRPVFRSTHIDPVAMEFDTDLLITMRNEEDLQRTRYRKIKSAVHLLQRLL